MQPNQNPMRPDSKNLILATVLSMAIIFAWQFFFTKPQLEKAQQQAQIEAQAQQAAVPGTTASNVLPRDQAVAAGPRVKIDTPEFSGSINLTGAALDDLTFKTLRVSVEPGSPNVTLLTPSGAQDAYFAESLRLCSLVDDLGYGHIRTVEHYFEPYGGYTPNPHIFLVAAAQRTKKARLVTGAVLPVFNHPLKVAGEIGMVDAMSNGRLECGFARAFLPHEFTRFGVPVDSMELRPGAHLPGARTELNIRRLFGVLDGVRELRAAPDTPLNRSLVVENLLRALRTDVARRGGPVAGSRL